MADIAELVESMIAPDGAMPFALMGESIDNVSWVDFTVVRPAFQFGWNSAATEPPAAELTAEEIAVLSEVDDRDYTSFYEALKQAVSSGTWAYLLAMLQQTEDIDFPVEMEFFTNREQGVITRAYVDGDGNVTQVLATYDVRACVDAMLLYLDAEILADFADIYFTVQDVSTSDAHFMREEFLSIVDRFWRQSSSSQYTAATEGKKRNALKGFARNQSYAPYIETVHTLWSDLRSELVGRFGEGGQDIGALVDEFTFRAPAPPPEYLFTVAPENEINLGLRLVYRQEWRPLGNQRGEVVNTISLGPKETRKVSTKVVRRLKNTRTAEDLRGSERTTERSDSTKNSSEVIEEASRSMKWNISTEIEGGVQTGVYSLAAKTSMGLDSESREASKETSSKLSETMQKVASKIRNESKVVVSTEMEETFEASNATEIQNANDEIAVTYVYSKLQHQYEVLTRLAEIQNVVMVAEKLPPPADIDFDWVKRHDWILAKVLLDDSFRDALSSISSEARAPNAAILVSDLKTARDSTISHLGTFSGTANVRADNIDMVVESQRSYRDSAKEQLQTLKANFELDAKRYRLYEHIRENILHYCRAIWRNEDPQQRLLRYKKANLEVPLEWRLELADGELASVPTLDELLGAASSAASVEGVFAAVQGGKKARLEDLINPAGPIGFFGNYSIYYMRPEFGSEDLFSMLHLFKAPYLAYNPITGEDEVTDPVQIKHAEDLIANPVSDVTIDAKKEEMFRYVPTLRMELARAQWLVDTNQNAQAVTTLKNDHAKLKAYYAEFLFRREQTRRLVLDTNSVVLDLIPGSGSVLESFKRLHRGIDVLKADQEREGLAQENDRRKKLIAGGVYGDPEIEKVVVVDASAAGGLGASIAASIAGSTASGPGVLRPNPTAPSSPLQPAASTTTPP